MSKRLYFFLIACLTVFYSDAQSYNWGLNISGSGSSTTRAITSDNANNVYALVMYTNTLTIDSAGTPVTLANFGNRDIAVIKYNCNKVFQWAIRIGTANNDGGNFNSSGLATDTAGNIYIHTTVNGSPNITSSNGTNITRTGRGQLDALLVKANNSGVVSWALIQGGTGNDESGNVTVDREQNVYIVGQYSNTGVFTQTSGGNQNLLSFGSTDYYVAKYTAAGTIDWLSRGGGNNQDNAGGVAVDSALNVYVSGSFGCCSNSFVNFGANNLNNTGGWGGFVAKYDDAGAVQWGTGMGTANSESVSKVTYDEVNDRVIAIGHFQGNSIFTSRPPGANINLTGTGTTYNTVVASMNTNGSLQWCRTFGGTGTEYGYDVKVDGNGNVYAFGEFSNITNFGGGNVAPPGTSSGYYAVYDMNNLYRQSGTFGGTLSATYAAHLSASGWMYAGGVYQGQMIVGSDTLNAAGTDDAFLARMQINDTLILKTSNSSLLCTGDTANLVLINKPYGNFTWTRNDTVFATTQGNTVRVSLPGTYKVISTNNCATPDTSAGIVITRSIYYQAPAVSDITICRGDSGRFNLTGATTYHWSPATGLSDTAVANPFVKVNSTQIYYITMTNNGCTALDTATVTVQANCCLTCSTPYDLNQGVVACYPFTGNANDGSGNGNNATVYNGFLTADRFGTANRAYFFNGFNSYMEVPNSPSLQSPGANLSFTFWARVSNWNFSGGIQFNPILSKSTAAGSAQYRGMIRSNGAYAMSNGKSYNGVMGSNTNTNVWYFFAIIVSNDTMYYYRNGALLGFVTGPTTYTLNNTTPLRIGRNDVNSTSFFNGTLDEVRVYGRTLNAAEVLKLYSLSNINGLPTVSAGIDKNICKGDSVQLTTTGSNGTWLWTPNVALTSDTARSPKSFPDTNSTYIVRVEVSGCRNYDTVNVNVVNFIPDAGVDRNICYGDTATLIVSSSGNTFAWTPSYRITSLTNDTTKVYPLLDTNYIVTVGNGLCFRKDTVRITVVTPTINAGVDQNVCDGDTAHINATSNGTVRWSPAKYLNDTVGLAIFSIPDSSISYIATANYLGCSLNDTINLSVANLPIDAGPNQLICYGDSVQLNASGGVNYIWLPNYRISDTSSASPWVKPLITTRYYVVAYNAVCSRFDSVLVDVKRAQADAGTDITICNNDSVRLNATAQGTWVWSPSSSLSDTTLKPWAKPTTTTDYLLSVTNSICFATDTVRVTVVPFNISAGTDKTICKWDSVQLNATGGTKYNWLPNYNVSDTGIANPWVKPLGPTTYFLISNNGVCLRVDTVFVDVKTITASAGSDTSMCKGQLVGLNASGGTSYLWLTTYNISDPYIANPLITPAFDTSYIVRIKDASSCTVYDTVHITVNDYPIVDAGPDYKICPGDHVTLLGDVKTYTRMEWWPPAGLSDKLAMQPDASPTAYTEYWLNAWNGGCFSADRAIVNVNPEVKASFKMDPDFGIAPVVTQFTNTTENGYFFEWDFDDLSALSNEKDPSHTFVEEGTYIVQLIAADSLGCTDTTYGKVTVTVTDYLYLPSAFTPNGDGLHETFNAVYAPSRFEFLEMSIFDRWGVKVFETKMPGGQWWDGKVNGEYVSTGVYTYYVLAKDIKGKTYERSGTVTISR